MSIFRRLYRRSCPVALGLLYSTTAFAAVSVTNTKVQVVNGNLVLSYRLNEAATSVQISTSGGTNVAGPTAQGLNQVNLPLTDAGGTATITASAPAANGPGGAAVISHAKLPDNRAIDPAQLSTAMVGVDVNRRAGSPYQGTIYMATGFGQAGRKFLWAYGSDGSYLFNKNLSDIYTSGSWPFAMGLVQEDPQDRVLVGNRTLVKIRVLTADLSPGAELPGAYCVPGLTATPNPLNALEPWNVYIANNKLSGIFHWTSDLTTTSTTVAGDMATNGTPSINVHDFSIDPTNSVLFKTQVSDSGAGSLADGNVSKFTSADSGQSWTEDPTWLATFQAAVTADLASAGSSLTTANLVGGGVSLASGFNAANMAGSSVWIALSGGTGATFFNRIYKVNAASGAIQQVIDVNQIPTPEGGVAYNDKSVHFIEADHAGNLVITLNPVTAMTGQIARFFAILAPNATSPSQASVQASLVPPPFVEASVDRDYVSNTGAGTVTYTAKVTDFKGIVADNAKVYVDLSKIGGDAHQAMTPGTVSSDGTVGEFTYTYTVPSSVDLNNSGAFDIAFTAETNSGNATVRLTQRVYNAYIPAWTSHVDGAVVGSAANGNMAYAATSTGKVYAFDMATGAPVSGFSGGSVNVMSPVQGQIVYENGRLFVPTAGGLVILNGGNGSLVASNAAIGPVSSVAATMAYPDLVYAAAGNRIYKLNANTGAIVNQSQDYGVAVNRIGIVPTIAWSTTAAIENLIVGGTAGDAEGKNGKIVMLQAGDLTAAFTNTGTGGALEYVDVNGPVKSAPAAGVDANTANFFVIGSTSGLWAINADTGEKLPWVAGSGGGANVGGNPYTTTSPVEANPTIPLLTDGSKEGLRILFATTGLVGSPGSMTALISGTGERVSFGGYPASLTTEGTGFAAGAGILAVRGESLGTTPAALRVAYLGSNGGDQRFYGLETMPDDSSYNATSARKHTFMPGDTQAFPGSVAGSFDVPPALSGNKVVIGSSAGRFYAFPSLTTTQPAVTAVTPSNGAVGVATSAVINLTFDQDVDPLAIYSDNVKLFLNGTEVITTVEPGLDARSVKITPFEPLQANATYLVWTGKALSQPFSATFYTGIPALSRADVQKILQIAGGALAATNAEKARYDLDGDGTVTLKDAARLNRQLNNL